MNFLWLLLLCPILAGCCLKFRSKRPSIIITKPELNMVSPKPEIKLAHTGGGIVGRIEADVVAVAAKLAVDVIESEAAAEEKKLRGEK